MDLLDLFGSLFHYLHDRSSHTLPCAFISIAMQIKTRNHHLYG